MHKIHIRKQIQPYQCGTQRMVPVYAHTPPHPKVNSCRGGHAHTPNGSTQIRPQHGESCITLTPCLACWLREAPRFRGGRAAAEHVQWGAKPCIARARALRTLALPRARLGVRVSRSNACVPQWHTAPESPAPRTQGCATPPIGKRLHPPPQLLEVTPCAPSWSSGEWPSSSAEPPPPPTLRKVCAGG